MAYDARYCRSTSVGVAARPGSSKTLRDWRYMTDDPIGAVMSAGYFPDTAGMMAGDTITVTSVQSGPAKSTQLVVTSLSPVRVAGPAPASMRTLGARISAAAAAAKVRNAIDLPESGTSVVAVSANIASTLTHRFRVGPKGGTAGNLNFVQNANAFRTYGGKPLYATERPGQVANSGVQLSGNDIDAWQFRSRLALEGGAAMFANQYAISNCWSVEVMYRGARLELECLGRGSQPYRLMVNDQYVSKTNSTWWGNTVSRIVIEPVNTAIHHHVVLEGQSFAGFCGANILATDTFYAAPLRPHIAFIGDSLTLGSNSTFFGISWCQVMAKLLGIRATSISDGGTGYNTTDSGTGVTAAAAVVNDLANEAYDMAVLVNGYNDYAAYNAAAITLASIQAGVVEAIRNVRALRPEMPILVMGTFAGRYQSSANLQAVETTIQAAVAQVGDPWTIFMPVSVGAFPSPWIYGGGRIGSTDGTGPSDLCTDTDNVHWGDFGHETVGRRAAAEFLRVVVPWLSGSA